MPLSSYMPNKHKDPDIYDLIYWGRTVFNCTLIGLGVYMAFVFNGISWEFGLFGATLVPCLFWLCINYSGDIRDGE